LNDIHENASTPMPSNVDNVILTFPPRSISQWERAALAEWFAATQREGMDVVRAFVSERRGDDPRVVGRIAIVLRSSKDPAFLVYSPAESTFWVVASAPHWTDLQRFRTLRAALNSIRPVLDTPDALQGAELSSDLVW
jgi:RimJ/RimL family protein N-acetyltransferase